jgi:hypothetical protein
MRSTDTTDTTMGCFQEFPIEQPSMEKSGKVGQIASVASEQVRPAEAKPAARVFRKSETRLRAQRPIFTCLL